MKPEIRMEKKWKDYGHYIVQYVRFATMQVAYLYYLSHIVKNALEVTCLDTFFVILEANKYICEAAMSDFSVFIRSIGTKFIVGRKS